ncbi:Uncharacterised protein [Klebsiella pneumoniae]|nr:Uncharacterised protein [Klebsiella pneumoniae]
MNGCIAKMTYMKKNIYRKALLMPCCALIFQH